MAKAKVKKKKVKVSKFKLFMEEMKVNPKIKKQIRLTLGSVFLITAIVIAAIPPGEIEASPIIMSSSTPLETRGNARYPGYGYFDVTGIYHEKDDLYDMDENNPFNARVMYNFPKPAGIVPDLSKNGKNLTEDNNISYTMRRPLGSDRWQFIEQFIWERIKDFSGENGRIIITEYINPYPESVLDLTQGVLNTEFYVVREAVFLKFYDIFDAVLNNGPPNPDAPGNKIYRYTIKDYRFEKTSTPLPGDDLAIIQMFAPRYATWQTYFNDYEDYEEKYNEWVADNRDGPAPPAPDGSITPTPPSDKWMPAEFTWRPNENTTDLFRRQFYCYVAENVSPLPSVPFSEWVPVDPSDPDTKYTEEIVQFTIEAIQGRGFTLELVTANTTRTGGDFVQGERIYVAKGSPTSTTSWYFNNNTDRFLVKQIAQGFVRGIGDSAFAGQGNNVETLKFPDGEFRFIGNSAFEGNAHIKSITVGSIYHIGNRAFKNCEQLENVSFYYGPNNNLSEVVSIGTEAFANCDKLRSLVFSNTVKSIGDGAFAFNHSLTDVDMRPMSNVDIGKYVFYDNFRMKTPLMTDNSIRRIGEGTFAVLNTPQGETFSTIELPGQLGSDRLPASDSPTSNLYYFQTAYEETNAFLGNYLFEGRSNLKEVTFPLMYGTNIPVKIPSGMFVRCRGLEKVSWAGLAPGSANGSQACFRRIDPTFDAITKEIMYPGYFGNLLFHDVEDDGFVVFGPENHLSDFAHPRQSTWAARTLFNPNTPITYMYYDRVTRQLCYEIGFDEPHNYRLTINENGDVISGVKIGTGPTGVVTIVRSVGPIRVKRILKGSMDGLNDMTGLIIQNDSLESIGDEAFKNFKKLKEVDIGDSVIEIGKEAFDGCENLTKVTFRAPKQTIIKPFGERAFATGSNELTFFGEIHPDFEPFRYATASTTLIDKPDALVTGKRIRYRTLLPTFLSVMYCNASNETVLLDYPRFANLDDMKLSEMNHHIFRPNKNRADLYVKFMEEHYYTLFNLDEAEIIGNRHGTVEKAREAFKIAYAAADTDEKRNDLFSTNPAYGPWIDDEFVEKYYANDDKVKAFYDYEPYSIKGKYRRNNIDGLSPRGIFDTLSRDEQAWVDSTLHLIIPEGIKSIDAKAFFNSSTNGLNASLYFNGTPAVMTDRRAPNGDPNNRSVGVTGGLFSGLYDDNAKMSPIIHAKGDDDILSISMLDVERLPDYAFDSCENLQSVSLGKKMNTIGKLPFLGCRNLTNLVATDNPNLIAHNGILYSKQPDDSNLRIEQALIQRGRLIPSSEIPGNEVEAKLIANVGQIADGAFTGCDFIHTYDFGAANKLFVIPTNCFDVGPPLRSSIAVTLPESVSQIGKRAFGDVPNVTLTIRNRFTMIDSDAFMWYAPPRNLETGHIIWALEESAPHEFVKYWRDVMDKGIIFRALTENFNVYFLDHLGEELVPTQSIPSGNAARRPNEAEEYKEIWEEYLERLEEDELAFLRWNRDNNFLNNIIRDSTIVAVTQRLADVNRTFTVRFFTRDNAEIVSARRTDVRYGSAVDTPNGPDIEGFHFTGWSVSSSDFASVTRDIDAYARYTQISGSPSPSGSPKPGEDIEGMFTVTVSGGSGSGRYAPGTIVRISAYVGTGGRIFDRWTTSSTGVGLLDANSAITTFTMPGNNVSLSATYKAGLSSSTGSGGAQNNESGPGGGGGGTGSGTSTRTNASVEITRPGIPNHELASASVSGSLDNFVIKISDSQAATDAVIAALTRHFGDLSNIVYFPMNIELFDASGLHKITDTTGLSISITMPLPTSQLPYGASNRVASAKGGILEHLNPRFSNIDGVPCVTFTTTHFSPFVIYADLDNLIPGTIDDTPKTGDGIHPKWFLVMGLVSMALILFLKREKAPQLKVT